jgi:hypothetical protein
MARRITLLLAAMAMSLGCGAGGNPREASSRARATTSVEDASAEHKKCPAGTFQCGTICCDASGDVSCVKGVCCVPPHCP